MEYNDDDNITLEVACQVIGGRHSPIHKATYYRGVKAGIFPKPHHPSPGISRVKYGQVKAAADRANHVEAA
ncbi:helix-turn-helix transcriptional regulator [Mesorhizobium sophorae]|uniref:helix-turn-helix transcriptional regulator n=1 Tax=Mesorhizobium sophorae TaxID=1300294 RepID=UPI000BA31DEE|nr:hypothetical protein [Mesorhizobium sophorae]